MNRTMPFAPVDVVQVSPCPLVPDGVQVLLRNGAIVWMGSTDMPIEDAVCDAILVSPDYYAALKQGQ